MSNQYRESNTHESYRNYDNWTKSLPFDSVAFSMS